MLNKFPFVRLVAAFGGIGLMLFASCLNPIGLSDTGFNLNVEAKISGEIDTNTRIIDNAVLWVINKTNSVDVTSLTIERDDNPVGYVPPMELTTPKHSSSVASYHEFTDKFYTVNLAWAATDAPSYSYSMAVDSPPVDAEPDTNSYKVRMQMPRAQDYVIYIFRDKDGNIKVIQGAVNVNGQLVINNEIWGFDSNGNFVNLTNNIKIEVSLKDNTTPPGPTTKNVSPLVIRNVTKTADITGVDFGTIIVDSNGPKRGGQTLFKLEPNAYPTTVKFQGPSNVSDTAEYHDVVIIDYTNNAQAWHTLYMYFYRTKTGGYGLSPSWPPVPNDAHEENNVEDTLSENEGILQIINKSETATPLAGILLDNKEMLGAGQMLLKDDTITFICDVGPTQVKFKPKGKNDYGFAINRTIEARKTTTLAYYDSLWAIDDIPPLGNYGSGLIKVVNNTTGSVVSAVVIDKNEPTSSLDIYTESFRPDMPISYGNTGYIPVVGTSDMTITSGGSYLVQLDVETENDLITIERLAKPLYNTIVTIVLNPDDLTSGIARHGANVKVINESSAQITSVQVYNVAKSSTFAVINEPNFKPAGSIKPDKYAEFRINSTQTVPILDNAQYKAYVIVSGNGQSRQIEKDFSPTSYIYDKDVTITVTEADLPGDLKFVPVENIVLTGGNNVLRAERSVDGKSWISISGPITLSSSASVLPTNASKQSPITWAVSGDWGGYADLTDGVLTMNTTKNDVVNIEMGKTISKTVNVTATIQGAGAGKTAISVSIPITLNYSRGTSTALVTGIDLSGGDTIYIDQGQTINLSNLVGFNPPNANINGIPISKNALTWTVTPTTGVVTLDGSGDSKTVTGSQTGNTTDQNSKIKVTLPASSNGTGGMISKEFTVIVRGIPITYKTLRIVRTARSDDTVKEVLLRQVSRGTYSDSVLQTGQSNENWNVVDGGDKAFKDKTKLLNYYSSGVTSSVWPNVWQEFACDPVLKKDGAYIDIQVPANAIFQVFVVEGDKVIRGYCNPSEWNPAKTADKFFVLDTEKATGKTMIDGKPGILVKYETYYNKMYY